MKNIIASLTLGLSLLTNSYAAEANPKTAEHLQTVSVTIRAEGDFSAGEGSGVIFTRKDSKGNVVNFVWTAGHVIDNLRKERTVLIDGTKKTIVEFKDPMIVKEIRQNGRTVGRSESSQSWHGLFLHVQRKRKGDSQPANSDGRHMVGVNVC